MPAEAETKTNELCEAILEQLQSNGIHKHIDAFLADDSARNQYEIGSSKGQALQEKQHHGQIVTNGGRVLGVTALGKDL